ncbi:FAD-dependent monooxygenase [Variovorax sp. KK3]|uniref:FAD-dependent monooxygenase n=1 Tax=Variovorax sp. KK3 TaxID=1855728 RepID=UPI00097BBD0D|nr:FAD-dependent monooxygenase [Variovorax sp. KK3]
MRFLKSVLIVGGGSAGLTCAAFLRKAGVAVEVSEISTTVNVGAALGLSSNALTPLREIGALDEILACSTPNLHMHVCDADGRTLVDLERPQPAGIDFPVNVIIARRELTRILTGVVEAAGATMFFGRQLVSMLADSDGVSVVFDDGREARYDAVVGADGIGSTVRRMIWGESPIQATAEVGWRWLTPARPSMRRGAYYLGSGGTNLGLFPIPGQQIYAVMGEPTDDGFVSDPAKRREDVVRRLGEQFDGAFARDALADLPSVEAIHFSRYPAMLMPQPWYKGRILLIGDAAHALPPHSSSGAAMAIEDGAVLYDELLRATEWEAGVHAFMERRWPRVKQVFEMACDRVRSKADPSARSLRDPHTGEKVKSLWKFLLQPF